MPIHICHDALNIEVTDFSILLISKYKQYKNANIANFTLCIARKIDSISTIENQLRKNIKSF